MIPRSQTPDEKTNDRLVLLLYESEYIVPPNDCQVTILHLLGL